MRSKILVSDNTDCNDHKASVHPGAPELCNHRDDDCDGRVDEHCHSHGHPHHTHHGHHHGNECHRHQGHCH